MFAFSGYASPTVDTEKKNEKAKDKKTEVAVDGPKDEAKESAKPSDELGDKKPKTYVGINSFRPTEAYIEADSLDQSGSVVTFNFLQYIIQNFKFSEEVF